MRLINNERNTTTQKCVAANCCRTCTHRALEPLGQEPNAEGKKYTNLIVKIEKFRLKQPNERKTFFAASLFAERKKNLMTFTIRKKNPLDETATR